MRASFAVAALLAMLPAASFGQVRSVMTTGVSVAAAYDENVAWRPAAQSDRVWHVSPSFSLVADTLRSSSVIDLALDSEWFSRQRDLSAVSARRHVSVQTSWRLTPRDTLGVRGGYDYSINPAELNLATGLTLGRVRASRWTVNPYAERTIDERFAVGAGYALIRERAALTDDVVTHEFGGHVRFAYDPRHAFRVRFTTELFRLPETGTEAAHTGLLEWTYRLSTVTSFTTGVGVRQSRGVGPEIDIRLERETTTSRASLAYTRTRTTSLGLIELVEVQSVVGRASYERPQVGSASVEAGYHRNEIGPLHTNVYRVSAEVTRRLVGVVSIGASYSFDLQRSGEPATDRAPIVIVDPRRPAGAGLNVHRNVALVRFIVSGTRRHASGPPEPPASRP